MERHEAETKDDKLIVKNTASYLITVRYWFREKITFESCQNVVIT